MKFYQSYSPSEIQKSIIREFQILHITWNESEPLPPPYITCLANTEHNLYFYPKDTLKVLENSNEEGVTAPSVVITGPKNKPIGLNFGKDYLMIKIAFHPTGLYRLLKVPMKKTVNMGLKASDYFSMEIEFINQKLRKSASYEDMIRIVSNYMDDQIAFGIIPEVPLDNVSIEMLDPFAKNTLSEWASRACLSLRQFERNFINRVGISPKLFLRIVRFEYAMKIKNNFPEKSWSDIAYECDYVDSSHLLIEFRHFADFPPGTLIKKQTSGFGDFPTG